MAGFHLPGDPYFPNQGNAGWIEEEPEELIEEDPEEDPEEEPEEEEEEVDEEEEEEEDDEVDMDEDESEEEPEEEVFNPPYIARVPANRWGHNGPEPRWATMIERWSRQQRQRSPYGDQRGYYDLSHGGPADRALPVMTQHITNLGNQSREMADQIRNLSAITAATDARTRDLERDFYPLDRLIEDLTAARAEVREYQVRHAALEERVIAAERRIAELQGASTSSQGHHGSDASRHE